MKPKRKKNRTWLPAVSAAAMMALFFRAPVCAEATKEFYSDQNPADLRLIPEAPNLFWGQDFNLDLSAKGDLQTPEGLNVAQAQKTGGDKWWGIFTASTQNYSAYSSGALRFWMKSNTAVRVEIESFGGVKRSTSLADTNNIWQEFVIPFSAFSANPSFNFSQIVGVFTTVATTNGNRSWAVDHVRWTKPVTSLSIFPANVTVQQNKKRQFTVEGRDAANEPVIIYSTFTSVTGSFAPAAGARVTASTFTAGAAGNPVTARTYNSSLSVQASVSISPSLIKEELGLLSETIPNSINLDTDSLILIASGNGGSDPALLDESSGDLREGVRRFRTIVPAQTGAAAFSGWFIQWGLTGDSGVTRDMNKYYDGAIRFWFKGPVALQSQLEVGIRSGNVTAGAELSKVRLNKYTTATDGWQSVAIPIKDLAGARPWADISRVKGLFSIFAVSTIAAPQTFYIDNLRWDTNIPGPLATLAIMPSSVTIPTSSVRQFLAKGFDTNGVSVDVFPTWTGTPAVGTLSSTQGVSVLLNASSIPASGTITATQGPSTGTVAQVNVANIIWTQSHNVYSDAGSGGYVGVQTGGGVGTVMDLDELSPGVVGDTETFRRATYSLVNSGFQDAFAVWFTNVDSGSGERFMRFYSVGYLSFSVRTTNDLQVAIRSGNINAGTEKSKIRLSEFGVPLNGEWQKVVIPLSEFAAREPQFDFDRIQTYFAITALSAQIGPVSNQTFDIDDVKWLTNDPAVATEAKMYEGLKEKQAPGGLVRSFNNLPRAVTYDQALAAMNFTYRKNPQLAQRIFNVYGNIYNGGAGFSGFHDEYDISSSAGSFTVLNSSRTAGPNAWMLLALIHYKNVTGSTAYDGMMGGIAGWLLALQDTDGAVRFGRVGGSLLSNKSTEHNFDCYAAFSAYSRAGGGAGYSTGANSIMNWLRNEMYIPGEQRFNVGERENGDANPDKALDAYSWAPLALSSFTHLLAAAQTDFGTTKTNDLTGIAVTGFDFSGLPTLPVDKDAVWLEGTGHMAVAYYSVGDVSNGDFYMQELEKAVVNTSTSGQGMSYATNNGTAYGFFMDSLNPAASSAAWYLFAKRKFNPFKPFPLHQLGIADIETGVPLSSVTWSVSAPASWVRASQVIKLDAQPISTDNWGIQIYTDNTNPSFTPRFVDPTPAVTDNPDSNPAGMLRDIGVSTTSRRLPLAWSIKDTTATATIPVAVDPASGVPASFQWLPMKDRLTPAIPSQNTTVFIDGENDVIVRKTLGSHTSQGPSPGAFSATASPDFIYLEANFANATAQTNYVTQIIVEFFLE